jgi:CBS domain-containing protein
MKVKDILKTKGPHVFTIGDEMKLTQALQTLVNNNIGGLLVLNSSGKIAGILTERDVLRISYKNPDQINSLLVKDVMTSQLIIVEPEDEISYVEIIMTENRIRHLPVVHNNILVGLISIGDVVKHLIKEVQYENKYLMDYIGGNVA